MRKKKLPKSIRKYIRREKARIRREVLSLKEQERLINEIYQKLRVPSKVNKEKKIEQKTSQKLLNPLKYKE